MEHPVRSVRGFCLRLLCAGDLETKLRPPRADDGAPLSDAEPGPALRIDAPARDEEIAMAAGAGPLPRPGELGAAEARARCLARFAHHELMAAELFAWALLRWPALPGDLRRAWLATLAEEQRHCDLYRARLRAHGSDLHEHALSDYFWKHVPAIESAANGPLAFLCAMGLTLEQANLDFTLVYRDAFAAAGDAESAAVCQRVHDDEIGHVRLAACWLERLAAGGSDVERYVQSVPFPLSAARAKGRRFAVEPRRRAGLSEGFIDFVRDARSTQETRTPPPRSRA
jgi:uncharacterized ferritin-like protein (DUF455 family)